MKGLVIGLVLGLGLVGAGASAASKCDAGISKAAGKKVACRCAVYAKAQLKGVEPDATKFDKCAAKFAKSCLKAQAAADCNVQGGSCPSKDFDIDNASNVLCTVSVETVN